VIHAEGSASIHRIEISASNVPPAVAALGDAAAAEGRRVPVVLGPPIGGEAQAGSVNAGMKTDGRLEINSAPLIRLSRAAAAKLGEPVLFVLRAEPTQRRCRAWLAMPGSTGRALEAGELPEGVVQLSEAAWMVEAEPPVPPWVVDGDTAAAPLETVFPKPTGKEVTRLHIPVLGVPTALRVMLEATEGARVPVVFGPPVGGDAAASRVDAILQPNERVHINSAALLRLLKATHEAVRVARAPLAVALRVEPGRLRLWLAPAGSRGRALEAPVLPKGLKQLSVSALASAPAPPRPAGGGSQPSAWALDDDNTAVGGLKNPLGNNKRLRIPSTAVPGCFEGIVAAAGGAAPVHLGPPHAQGHTAAAAPLLKAKLRDSGRAEINSAPLMRLLVASDIAAEAAGGAPLELVFRADPTLRACFLWLAPAGSRGRALTAPVLPAGVAQLSSAALKKRK